MASTTLMTFLVRTPPTARSVNLCGSWDNFAKTYPMKRDVRVGPEHWSGCHSFSNIICDGNVLSESQPREGGLRMGGTYWYYYKLDDDIEFHNASEPSTTLCPMLPGQLVNVLHVPFALSGSHSRNPSVSSTSSERRTMNPSDKFMNPRAVPPPPLPRLKTSPTLPQDPYSAGSSPASAASGRSATSGQASSHPGSTSSAGTLRMFKLPRKASFDAVGRQISPNGAISGGIKSAFRSFRSPRSGSPDGLLPNSAVSETGSDSTSVRDDLDSNNLGHNFRGPRPSRETSPSSGQPRRHVPDLGFELALRRPNLRSEHSSDGIPFSSFQQHRRQRSNSREPSSLRNSLVLEDSGTIELLDSTSWSLPLDTLKEVASAQNTPGLPVTAKLVADNVESQSPTEVDLEKRLPTLPSTPSSAYPPSSAAEASPPRRLSEEIASLQSHFSSTTIDTSSSVDSRTTTSYAHLSNWSSQYTRISTSSMLTDSSIEAGTEDTASTDGLDTPQNERGRRLNHDLTHGEETPQQTVFPAKTSLPSTFSCSTVGSTASSSPILSSPVDDDDDRWDTIERENAARYNRYLHYRLPAVENGSDVTLKTPEALALGPALVADKIPAVNALQYESISQPQAELPHTTSMQQLLSDLSYLGEMIHQN